MLKIIKLPNKSASSRNNGNKLAFSKNNNNKPAFRKNNGNNKIDGFSVSKNSTKHAKKSEKLSKSRKSKSKKCLNFKIWLNQEKNCQKVGI